MIQIIHGHRLFRIMDRIQKFFTITGQLTTLVIIVISWHFQRSTMTDRIWIIKAVPVIKNESFESPFIPCTLIHHVSIIICPCSVDLIIVCHSTGNSCFHYQFIRTHIQFMKCLLIHNTVSCTLRCSCTGGYHLFQIRQCMIIFLNSVRFLSPHFSVKHRIFSIGLIISAVAGSL